METCGGCAGSGKVLHFWRKPGGMGNGWLSCHICDGSGETTMLKNMAICLGAIMPRFNFNWWK